MKWEDILMEGLKPGKDFSESLSEAAEVAPPHIKKILIGFPESVSYSKKNIESLEKNREGIILLLLHYNKLSVRAEGAEEFPQEEQKNILESGVKASTAAAELASSLHEKKIEARYLSMTGDFLFELEQFSQAEKAYMKSIERYKEVAQENPEYRFYLAMCLNNLGTTYIYSEKVLQAEETYTASLSILRELTRENSEAHAHHIAVVLNNVGNFYTDTNNYAEGKKAQTEALEIRRMLAEEDPETYMPEVAKSLSNFGTLYMNNNNVSQAETAFTEALAIRRELAQKNPELYSGYVAENLTDLGILYKDTDRTTQAEKAFTEALRIERERVQQYSGICSRNLVWTLANLGDLYSITDRFLEAEKAYTEALNWGRTLAQENLGKYKIDMATILEHVGVFYRFTNQFSKAEKVYKEASEIVETYSKINPKVYTRNFVENFNITGKFYYEIKEFLKAERFYKKALKIARNLAQENPRIYNPLVARILENLGILYRNTTKSLQAENAYTEALTILRELEQKNPGQYTYDISSTLESLGILYSDINNYSKAEKAFKEALKINKELAEKDPEVYALYVTFTLHYLGNFYLNIDKCSQAEHLYKEVIEEFRRREKKNPYVYSSYTATVLTKLGTLYNITGEFSKAEKVLTEALRIRRELAQKNPDVYGRDIAVTLGYLANMYAVTDKVPQAEKAYTEALTILRELAQKNPDAFQSDIAVTLNNLGNFYQDTGRSIEAEKAFMEALRIQEDRALWLDLSGSYYCLSFLFPDKIEYAVRIHELGILFSGEKMYTYAQKGKSEGMYLRFLSYTDDPQQAFAVLEALRDPELLSLEWNLEERVKADKDSQKKIVKSMLRKRVSPRSTPFQLPHNQLYVYIQKMKDTILYLTVTKERTELFKHTSDFADIGLRLRANLWYQVYATRHKKDLHRLIADFNELSRTWALELPPGVVEMITQKGIVVFSPDSISSSFPLEGLSIEGEPLCLSKEIVRATSMHQIQQLSRVQKRGSSLIMGNPWPYTHKDSVTYTHPSPIGPMRYLEDAEKEAEMLAKYLPNPHVLTGSQATADAFLGELPNHSIIHVAGHGILGRVLFFSGPMTRIPPEFEPEEFLRLRKAWKSLNGETVYMTDEWDVVTDLDIFETSLQKGALVFLSACETGKHIYAGGGHFQGLAQAFLKSGASNVISSLIPLHDKPSADFALTFYESLSHQSVSTALQNTRKKIKEKYKAHIYWLPYIHYGSPFDSD